MGIHNDLKMLYFRLHGNDYRLFIAFFKGLAPSSTLHTLRSTLLGGEWMFRFENLEIWKRSIELAERLFDIADDLERKKLYRFADQLRGAGLSVSNNIAEGSGSNSQKEFIQLLNIAKLLF